MTVLDWPPDIAPINGFFDLFDQAAVYTDQRTKASLRQRRAAPVWTAQFQFAELCPDKWKALTALRARLEGPINTVRLYDFSDSHSGGLAGVSRFSDGTEFSDGTVFGEADILLTADAAIGAETLHISTNIVSEERVLIAGDKIGIGEYLYMVLEAVATDADGLGTVSIAPPLLEAVAEGDEVITEKPTALFYLTSWQDPVQRDVEHFGAVTWSFTQDQLATGETSSGSS